MPWMMLCPQLSLAASPAAWKHLMMSNLPAARSGRSVRDQISGNLNILHEMAGPHLMRQQDMPRSVAVLA